MSKLREAADQVKQGYTDGGRNMFYEGLFEGESERQRAIRLRWADDMRAAFERHFGQSWFDKDWYAETGIWSAAWSAATVPPSKQEPVAWTLTEFLDKRETTTNAPLWFVDPVNSAWTPLYTAPPSKQEQAEKQEPYAYIYETNGAFGVHQSLRNEPYNGRYPDKTIPVYTEPMSTKPENVDTKFECVDSVNIETVELKHLRDVHAAQGSDGAWNSNQYMCGLFNGLELALSIFENREPVYKELAQPEQEPVVWQNKELPMEFYEYEHLDPMWHHHYRPLYAAPPIKPEPEIEEQLADALDSLDFYRRRIQALEKWQSKMRDPERMIVCDIIANGFTLCPEGDRYTAPPSKPWVSLSDRDITGAAHNEAKYPVSILETTDSGLCMQFSETGEWFVSDKRGDFMKVNNFLMSFARAIEAALRSKNEPYK